MSAMNLYLAEYEACSTVDFHTTSNDAVTRILQTHTGLYMQLGHVKSGHQQPINQTHRDAACKSRLHLHGS